MLIGKYGWLKMTNAYLFDAKSRVRIFHLELPGPRIHYKSVAT